MNTLPVSAKHYIWRETLIGCGFNASLAIVFAILLFSQIPTIPMWGADGVAMDLLPTVFILTSLGGLVLSLITRKRLRRGIVEPWRPEESEWLASFLATFAVVPRVLIVTLAMTVIIVPATWLMLQTLNIHSLPFLTFVGFKVLYAPIIGAISAPWMLKAELLEPALVPGRRR